MGIFPTIDFLENVFLLPQKCGPIKTYTHYNTY